MVPRVQHPAQGTWQHVVVVVVVMMVMILCHLKPIFLGAG